MGLSVSTCCSYEVDTSYYVSRSLRSVEESQREEIWTIYDSQAKASGKKALGIALKARQTGEGLDSLLKLLELAKNEIEKIFIRSGGELSNEVIWCYQALRMARQLRRQDQLRADEILPKKTRIIISQAAQGLYEVARICEERKVPATCNVLKEQFLTLKIDFDAALDAFHMLKVPCSQQRILSYNCDCSLELRALLEAMMQSSFFASLASAERTRLMRFIEDIATRKSIEKETPLEMPAFLTVLLRCALHLKKFESMNALEAATEACRLAPSEACAWYALALSLEDHELILQAIERCLAIEPKFAMGHTVLALNQKSYDAIERELKIAIELENREPLAHFHYACLLTEKNDLHSAETHFRLALESRPKYTQAKSAFALILIKLKRFQEAQLLLEDDLSTPASHNAYGLLLKYQDQYTEAESHFRQAVKMQPNHVDALNNLGLLVMKDTSRIDEAETLFKRAIDACAMHPDALMNPDPYNNLGHLLLTQKNDRNKAQYYFKTALQIDPYHAVARNNYANTLLNIDSAQNHLQTALSTDPNYADAHNSLALILHLVRYDYTAAEHHYLRALALDPSHSQAHANYALFLIQQNNTEKAHIHFNLALEANPHNTTAASNLAFLLLTKAATSDQVSEDLEHEAEDLLLKALHIDPHHAASHETYGILQDRRNQLDLARRHFLASIEADPKRISAYCRYAQLLIQKNDFDTAKYYLQVAIDQQPNAYQPLFLLAHIYERRGAFEQSLNLINTTIHHLTIQTTNSNTSNPSDDSSSSVSSSSSSLPPLRGSNIASLATAPDSSLLSLQAAANSSNSLALLSLDYSSASFSAPHTGQDNALTHQILSSEDLLQTAKRHKSRLENLMKGGGS